MAGKGGKLVTEGRLRFWTAASTTVLVATPIGAFKLFKIMFGGDGSIYVPFPYLDTKRGILSEVDPATEQDPKTLQLRRNGIVVEYDVKFAHHASGVVHFSKSGMKDVLPRRHSFPLSGPIGRLFEFYVYWPQGYKAFDRTERRRNFTVRYTFSDGPPAALRVRAEWRRKADIVASIDPRETTEVIGPAPLSIAQSTGIEQRCILLGQPQGSPLQDHVVMLFAEPIPVAAGADSATGIFLGGWDAHENKSPETARMLVFLYPVLAAPSAG